MDHIESLGILVLDHRFKRLCEKLLDEAREVYQELNLPVKPRWTSTYLLLQAEGPTGVTEIARRIRLTHPAVIQIAREMEAAGMAEIHSTPEDARMRLLALTRRGKQLGPRLREVWRHLSKVQDDIFRRAGCNIMDVIQSAEGQMAERSVRDRVLARMARARARSDRRPGQGPVQR